jgi:nickel-dependent lactate racemase
MDVEILLKNGLVPLVLCVKDIVVIVHDLTLSTKFKLHISPILLEKIVLNYIREVT